MKSINVSVSEELYNDARAYLDALAETIIPPAETGQRGKARSVFVIMLVKAAMNDFAATVRLLKQIKTIADNDLPKLK